MPREEVIRRQRGFCYVASTPGYCDEALESLATLRAHMPEEPVAIVTSKDQFRPDPRVTDWVELPSGREGGIVKTAARLVPYDQVVCLDTDTLIVSDLTDLFAILEMFDLAATVDVTRGYDYGFEIPSSFPELNTGVIAFRNEPSVEALFREWESQYDLLCRELGVGAMNDQPAFRAALWKTRSVRYAALSSEYNFFGSVPGSAAGRIRLVHHRGDRVPALAADLNREVGPRAFVPGLGAVFPCRGRRHWLSQFMRLTFRFVKVLIWPATVQGKPAPVDWTDASEAEAVRSGRPTLP